MRRFKKHEEHENHERWLVSYADFITLLFAFFVVMYATSTKNEEKEKKFEDSVKASLKIAVVGVGGAGGSASSQMGGNSVLEKWVPELARGKNEDDNEAFPEKGSPGEVQDYIKRQLSKKISSEKLEKDFGPMRHDSKGVRVTLAASSFFPSGSYRIKRSSLQTLDEVAEVLRKTNRRVIIEGHTDNTPVAHEVSSEGENEVPVATNWELASLRATSVVRYLVQVHGIDPKRLAAISYADQKPVDSNETVEGRAKNRRIEILIEGD